ncbi:F-box domain, Leucine-rich repeat domain, L domain-like protein [Artemisia annua]|uniref:F-box domain, Leucine-rich repeat domain, L domain-like protein n=1 Tax=Artemisia annua TaxID=35608 RepID=A0A2U1KA95_ARTAN|nr:F-box domain, Leucine-rich repeat domain, L domain-like protein [Artemisia annua]
MNNFKKFVSWALANKTVDLDSFRLCCAGFYKKSTVKEWIKAAVKRKVKSLDIMFYPGSMTENITMPVCLITCDSLEVLRLFLYRCTLHMPNHTGFRALKVLELNHIHCYDFDLPEQFIKMCPLLEELSLVECSRRLINVPARISSPKLKILILGAFCLNTLDNLKKAVILPEDKMKQKISYRRGDDICETLAGMSHVESLSINLYFIQVDS